MGSDLDSNDNSDHNHNVTTYLDELYLLLRDMHVEESVIDGLYEFIQAEQYETDSFTLDITLNGVKGNVLNHTNNERCNTSIMEPIDSLLSISMS